MNDADLWAAVVGQPDATNLLRSAAAAPVHAYMFIGPPGTGRLEAARAFAGTLFAAGAGSGDAADRHRRLAAAGQHPDLVMIVPTGRALLIAEIATIIREGSRSPVEAAHKVIVVDRFETAEPVAAAGLLKTIEEPPASTVFILLAEEVPEEHSTVASRCIRVDFPPLPDDVVATALVDESVDRDLAVILAEAAGGRLDRARLLASDPAFLGRRDAWRSVPDRLDGTGTAVAVLVAELQSLIDGCQKPLATRHEAEMKTLTEREEELGTRGSGRRDLVERQRREVRRLRDDELRFGLATLSRCYLDRATSEGRSEGLDATGRVTAAAGELVRNPNEALLLQSLFLGLPRAV